MSYICTAIVLYLQGLIVPDFLCYGKMTGFWPVVYCTLAACLSGTVLFLPCTCVSVGRICYWGSCSRSVSSASGSHGSPRCASCVAASCASGPRAAKWTCEGSATDTLSQVCHSSHAFSPLGHLHCLCTCLACIPPGRHSYPWLSYCGCPWLCPGL